MKRKALWAGVLALMILLACAGCQRELPREEKEVVKGYASWPSYSFEEAIAEAKTIVYGKAVSKSDVVEEVTSPPEGFDGGEGATDTTYYCEVSLEPITLVKGEAGENGKVVVRDFEVETDTKIYDTDGVDPIELEQEYVFFLNEYNVFFGPSMMMLVEDGQVSTSVLPTSVKEEILVEQGKDLDDYANMNMEQVYVENAMPVEEYLALIEEAM